MQEGKSMDYSDFYADAPKVNDLEDILADSVPSIFNMPQQMDQNGNIS